MEIRVQNQGQFGELVCDCGFGQHAHQDCKCGMKCSKCGIITTYDSARPQFIQEGGEVLMIFVCRYCRSSEYAVWSNLAAAKFMYPGGCRCENNGDHCDFCKTLLTEGE